MHGATTSINGTVLALEYINSRIMDVTDNFKDCTITLLAEIAEEYRRRGEGELFWQAGRLVLQH